MFASILDKRLSEEQVSKYAASASITVALVLIAVKSAGYVTTGSISLLSSLVDSASDVVASLGTYIGVRTALRPADADHRFGHGKAEAMAALGTAAFVLGSSSFMIVEAFSRLITRVEIQHGAVGTGIMLFSIVLTSVLVWFQSYVAKRTTSTAIAADAVHYQADLVMNAAIIISLILTSWTGIGLIDAFCGILIAVWLVWKVIPIARSAVDMLMDKELPEPERNIILSLARAHPQVKGVHDLRTRQSGSDVFIELHVEFDPEMTLRHVHAVGAQIELAVRQNIPHADVVIHFDPEGEEEHRRDDEIRAVEEEGGSARTA